MRYLAILAWVFLAADMSAAGVDLEETAVQYREALEKLDHAAGEFDIEVVEADAAASAKVFAEMQARLQEEQHEAAQRPNVEDWKQSVLRGRSFRYRSSFLFDRSENSIFIANQPAEKADVSATTTTVALPETPHFLYVANGRKVTYSPELNSLTISRETGDPRQLIPLSEVHPLHAEFGAGDMEQVRAARPADGQWEVRIGPRTVRVSAPDGRIAQTISEINGRVVELREYGGYAGPMGEATPSIGSTLRFNDDADPGKITGSMTTKVVRFARETADPRAEAATITVPAGTFVMDDTQWGGNKLREPMKLSDFADPIPGRVFGIEKSFQDGKPGFGAP